MTSNKKTSDEKKSTRMHGQVNPVKFSHWVLKQKKPLNYNYILANTESQFSSILPHHMADVNSSYEKEFTVPPETIIDACAHIGVDTFFLRKMFPESKIDAIEIDNKTWYLLNLNCANLESILGEKCKPIETVNKNCLEYFQTMLESKRTADLIYLDPPWGGIDYRKSNKMTLMVGDQIVGDVVNYLLQNRLCTVVSVKLPVNIDMEEFQISIQSARYTTYSIRNLSGRVSYLLVFVRI